MLITRRVEFSVGLPQPRSGRPPRTARFTANRPTRMAMGTTSRRGEPGGRPDPVTGMVFGSETHQGVLHREVGVTVALSFPPH